MLSPEALLLLTAGGAVGALWGRSRTGNGWKLLLTGLIPLLVIAAAETGTREAALLVAGLSWGHALTRTMLPALKDRYQGLVASWCITRDLRPAQSRNMREARGAAKALRGLSPAEAEVLQVLWQDTGNVPAASVPELAGAARAVCRSR